MATGLNDGQINDLDHGANQAMMYEDMENKANGSLVTRGEPSPYAVLCTHGKRIPAERCYLTRQEYTEQMCHPDALWACPVCGRQATWDDENYEKWLDQQEDNGPDEGLPTNP